MEAVLCEHVCMARILYVHTNRYGRVIILRIKLHVKLHAVPNCWHILQLNRYRRVNLATTALLPAPAGVAARAAAARGGQAGPVVLAGQGCQRPHSSGKRAINITTQRKRMA